MSLPAAWPQCVDFFGVPLVIEPFPGQLSSDAGLLPIRQFDERIGLTRAFLTADAKARRQSICLAVKRSEKDEPSAASEGRSA